MYNNLNGTLFVPIFVANEQAIFKIFCMVIFQKPFYYLLFFILRLLPPFHKTPTCGWLWLKMLSQTALSHTFLNFCAVIYKVDARK